MGVDKEELSRRCFKTFKGHFLKSGLSTFKAELLSHCSSTVVYEISFSSSESLLFVRIDAGDRKQVQGKHVINYGHETGQEQRLCWGQSNDINADTGSNR